MDGFPGTSFYRHVHSWTISRAALREESSAAKEQGVPSLSQPLLSRHTGKRLRPTQGWSVFAALLWTGRPSTCRTKGSSKHSGPC